MKGITLLFSLSLAGIVFLYSSIGFGQDQNCGRLKTGDSFNRINEILDCIESKVRILQSKESPIINLPNQSLASAKEPNDRISDATPIAFGSTVEGKLTKQNLTDWYVFKTPESAGDKSVLVFRWIGGESIRVELEVYDADENRLKSLSICCRENGS